MEYYKLEWYQHPVSAIDLQMGEATENGFVLLEPNIQVFEKTKARSGSGVD
ncbi:hypothetical protein H6G81_28740 [Scytonema hofmannii FACHB-248]|uniref:Uncharacterized protein n=1 Tax=Scytonema hofmannii FACHB-248 TaxID=1842502 RepID=A0ABR8H042_9CYAN|nr:MULTISPECIES: hypothetical protein [Nostocales]MBD2608398.1 hypothetical protein [Scytonema hofmannii FACHB-248]